MGKVKKSKSSKTKVFKSVENGDKVEPLPDTAEDDVVQTVIDQLQAINMEEKYSGLQTLTLFIENADHIHEVINQDVVKVIAPLLMDSAGCVRNAAAGVLRNLSASGHEICASLMDQDIMTSLICYFHKFGETLNLDLNSKSSYEDLDTLIQCINLLWNLCESSELAVNYLGQSRILAILPRYLDISFGNEIVIAILQFLYVVVEDNPSVCDTIKLNFERHLQQFLSLKETDPAKLLIQTLAAGVIVCSCNNNVSDLPVEVITQINNILANVLSVDHRLACNHLSSDVPLQSEEGQTSKMDDKSVQLLQNKINSVCNIIDAQQSCIEIIANICSGEETDEVIDEDDVDAINEMGDDEQCDNDSGTLIEDKLPPEVLEGFVSHDIFNKVWAKTQLPAENVMLILKEFEGTKKIHKKLPGLQSAALLCVNNMLSTLPFETFGGVNGVFKIWVEGGKLAFKQTSNDVNLLESATAVMRAALDKIKLKQNGNSTGNELFCDLSLSDIEMMLNGLRECEVPEIKSNLIRMCGMLALILMNTLNDTTVNVICTITEFILEQALKEHEVWVLAEAIDTIIDLYSEEESDALAIKVNLVEKLTVLAPLLLSKARQQKKLPKEYKVLVSTATANLPRFIKYKKKRLST